MLSFFIFPYCPKSKVNTLTCAPSIKFAYIISHFGYAMLPSFPCLIRYGHLFPENHLLQKGNECICKLRILFHIKINCNLKLQKLQDPPVFHARRQIQLSLWYRQINQGKVNYWLAQKVVNGRAENYTFKKCCDVQAIFKTFLCLKEGIVQVQTRCGSSYCTRLMQHLRIMMPHILKITIFSHTLLSSLRPCCEVKKWHPSNQASRFCSWQWEFH